MQGEDEDSFDAGDIFLLIFILFFCFGSTIWAIITYVLGRLGIIKPKKKNHRSSSVVVAEALEDQAVEALAVAALVEEELVGAGNLLRLKCSALCR